jgi:4-hydroxythreonine-4-phosphate dehydrogenase
MTHAFPPIAITVGDTVGIGPEVVKKALNDPELPRDFEFSILGSKEHPGEPARSRAALDALEEATLGCLAGRFAAMVTGPVSKESLARVQPDFVGQTEFLARTCGLPDDRAVMCLTDPKLTVALCTNHCSLREALDRLTPERIIYVVKITHDFVKQAGLSGGRPTRTRLAFAGINPHMGEGGMFGTEDQRIVLPALEKLRAEGLLVWPSPADTIFHQAVNEKRFDAVICAYHDQGLIPFKLVAFATGVNVTLGLPIIRTSPDHGTAREIAGQGKADHRSMLAAVQLACRLVRAKAST